jgi:tRNA(Ile)-lysidine synthase
MLMLTVPRLDHYWVGYSGGLDSTVLLHWLANHCAPQSITALYINHQLHPAANEWQVHTKQVCQQLGVHWHGQTVQVRKEQGQSLEEAARLMRYAAFAEVVPPAGHLFLAHHQQDQVETLLLQLLRGSGVNGLAAMPTARSWEQRCIHRVLLDTPRTDILQYAKEHRLTWIEDDANNDLAFARNRVRHHLLPVLQREWPGSGHTITRSAALCGEARELLDELALIDYALCRQSDKHQLLLAPLRTLSAARQRNVLRYWITALGYRVPNHHKLMSLQKTVLAAREDANPMIRWGDVELRRYRDSIWLLPASPALDTTQQWSWDITRTLSLPHGLGRLTAKIGDAANADSIALPAGHTSVTVGLRQGGERCYLPGRCGSRSLKKLLQTWGIPPWQRDRIPLIFYQNQLICMPGWLYGEAPCVSAPVTHWQMMLA